MVTKMSSIISKRRIDFTEGIKQRLSALLTPEQLTKAEDNSKKVIVETIQYSSNGKSICGYIVSPRAEGIYPVIIFNRGGNQDFGSIKLMPLFLRLSAMASWGYVVVASQYSGGPGSEGLDQFGGDDIYDILNLYDLLPSIDKTDTSRVGMYGGSRGGMMTYLALSKVSWIKAAVIVAGSADLKRNALQRPEIKKVFEERFGGSDEEMEKRSAVCFAGAISKKAPILLMHGSADWRVSTLDSLDMSRKFIEEKVPHRLVIFEGGDHGLSEHRKESMTHTHNWLERYVKNSEPLPDLEPHGD